MYFYVEVVNNACYTQNRILINKDHEKTPYHIMANNKPNVSYFHMFGGKCYELIEDEHLGKFEAKAQEGIFLGYSMESKSYRVYVIDHKKVIESINVTFDDGKLPSLQIEYPNKTLKFENIHDSYLEIDDEPEPARIITSIGNEDSDLSNENNEGSTKSNSN